MIKKSFFLFCSLIIFTSLVCASEPYRLFKTPTGQSLEGRAVGYEGQTFILADKSGELVQVPLRALSVEDQTYLIRAAQANKIPKGRPTSIPPPPSQMAVPSADTSNAVSKGVDFHTEIMPILEARCNECHKAPYEKNGRTMKPKAGLRFDSYEWLMKGFGDDPVIVPGDDKSSILMEVVTLPPDDDMIMPPKGDPLTKDQINLLRNWILEGATEKPSDKVVTASSSVSSEIVDDPDMEIIHKPSPPKKVTFRPGSFFGHIPVPLGISPEEALAKAVGAKPKPGEAIDFDRHVLPILKENCNSCHHAPFDRSGRLVNPKASLRFDTFAQVMKGNLDGPVVVANDLEKSRLYSVLNLPEDDDLFMPPKGGPMDVEQIDIIKRWIMEGAKPSKGGLSPTKGGIPAPDEPVSFHNHILPLFEQKCMECHGAPFVKNSRTIKPRAGLRLDTYEWVLKGNLDGHIVTPGDHTDSTLHRVITLAEDDPEIMPPKGGPLSEDEITMIKRWILEGASEQPAAEAADPNAPPKVKKVETVVASVNNKISILDQLSKRASTPSKSSLLAAEKTGALVRQIAENSSLVRAEFSSFASEVKDENMGAFSGIKNNISHLDVSRTKITDRSMTLAGSYPNLNWISLRNTEITDNGLKPLTKLQFLQYINLSGTQVTDKSISTLASMKSLNEIYLWNSQVTESGAEKLRESLPEAKIIF
ncbi:MAG: c-type cytochrome domain-containing protein [Verrucomicrobiota bacterium]|nr:c-type cytochrome domain-containing protein [Verrucomicrobiota bacterium]